MIRFTEIDSKTTVFNVLYYGETIGYIRQRLDHRFSLTIFSSSDSQPVRVVLTRCTEDSIMPYIILAGYEK